MKKEIEAVENRVEGSYVGRRAGKQYPLPCCTHFGNLKCAQQGITGRSFAGADGRKLPSVL